MQDELKIKINLKKFFLLSLLCNAILIGLFIRTQTEIIVYFANYWVVLGYLVFLYKGGLGIANAAIGASQGRLNKTTMLLMFVGKIFLIFGALSLSVHFIGNKILVPLLNYIIHLFILALSMWKFQKKP